MSASVVLLVFFSLCADGFNLRRQFKLHESSVHSFSPPPPQKVSDCKECYQKRINLISSSTSTHGATTMENQKDVAEAHEGLVNLKGDGETVTKEKEEAADPSSKTGSPNRRSSIQPESVDHQDQGTGQRTEVQQKEGGGEKSSGGKYGGFSVCKPWLGDSDPCNPIEFKPIHLGPPAAILDSLPGVPIAAPFMGLAKPLIIKSLAGAISLGKKEHAHAQKLLDDNKKERDTVAKALDDLSTEKKARIASGTPPPGLIPDEGEDGSESGDDGKNDEDPCPVDASGK